MSNTQSKFAFTTVLYVKGFILLSFGYWVNASFMKHLAWIKNVNSSQSKGH